MQGGRSQPGARGRGRERQGPLIILIHFDISESFRGSGALWPSCARGHLDAIASRRNSDLKGLIWSDASLNISTSRSSLAQFRIGRPVAQRSFPTTAAKRYSVAWPLARPISTSPIACPAPPVGSTMTDLATPGYGHLFEGFVSSKSSSETYGPRRAEAWRFYAFFMPGLRRMHKPPGIQV